MVPVNVKLNLSIVVLFAALHELASASARTLLKLASSVRALLKPYWATLKMNLYFTYESRDTLKSFTLFISVKAITNLNLGHRDKSEIKILNCI